MATQAQIDANRQNAQHSTGPRTPEGIASCKNNATRHGLCSQQIVIKGEDPSAYDELRAELIAQHEPVTEIESMLVEQIAQQWWRLSRARRIEKLMFEEFGEVAAYTNKGYLNLQRQMTSTERSWKSSVKELREMQDSRMEHEDNAALAKLGLPPIGSVSAKPPIPSIPRLASPSSSPEAKLTNALAILDSIRKVR